MANRITILCQNVILHSCCKRATIKKEVMKVNELPQYYTRLFNGVTDAIDALQHMKYSEGLQLLIQAQQEAEDLYMKEGGTAE